MHRFEPDPGQMDEIFKTLREKIEDGVRHGFFDFEISCEALRDEERRITLRAGKNYRFRLEPKEEAKCPKE